MRNYKISKKIIPFEKSSKVWSNKHDICDTCRIQIPDSRLIRHYDYLYWLHWVCEADDAIECRESVWTSSVHSNVVLSSRLHLSQGNTLFSLNDFGLNMAQLVLIYIPRFWIIPDQFFFTDIVVNIHPVFRQQTFASRGAAHFCRQVRNTQV